MLTLDDTTRTRRWPLGSDARGRAITLVRRPGVSGALEFAIFQDGETADAGSSELYGLTADLLVRIGEVGGSKSG